MRWISEGLPYSSFTGPQDIGKGCDPCAGITAVVTYQPDSTRVVLVVDLKEKIKDPQMAVDEAVEAIGRNNQNNY